MRPQVPASPSVVLLVSIWPHSHRDFLHLVESWLLAITRQHHPHSPCPIEKERGFPISILSSIHIGHPTSLGIMEFYVWTDMDPILQAENNIIHEKY